MTEYRMIEIGGHIEVYGRGGEFIFSADTVQEALGELRDETGPVMAA